MTIEQTLSHPLFNKGEIGRSIYPDKPPMHINWKIAGIRGLKMTEDDHHLIRNYFKTNFNIDVI